MSKINFEESKNRSYIGIVIAAIIFAIFPVILYGIPSGNDLPQHFQFANAYYQSIITADGFPSWSADENFGYGSIGIRFYPPLSYYVLAFFRIICGSWFDAAWVTFAFWMIVGCFGIYFWSRWWLSPKISLLAAAIFTIFPYHLKQLYTSFIYADFAGAAILPFCFAFQIRVIKRGNKSDILGLGISYALLILTHLPSAIVGSVCLAVYGLILLQKGKFIKQICRSAAGIFLGLAATSYYWLAMITEMSWVNHVSEEFRTGHFFFAYSFFPLYTSRPSGEYTSNHFLTDALSFFCFLFFFSAVIYLFYRRKKDAEKTEVSQIYRTVLPLGLFAVFMSTQISYPLWIIFTPLQKLQFPWRWMTMVSICGSIITAASIHFLIKGEFLKKRSWIYTSIFLLAACLTLDYVLILSPSASTPIERARFESDMIELPEQQNGIFWWSIWSKDKALKIKEKVLTENRQNTISDWKAEQRNFTVEAGAPTLARIGTFYYPHWKAEVNGSPVPVERDENGAMLIPIPAEKSSVRLYFQEPLFVKISSYFSILTWLMIFAASLFLLYKKFVVSKGAYKQFNEEDLYTENFGI